MAAKARLEGELGWTDSAFVRGMARAMALTDKFASNFANKAGKALMKLGKWSGAAMIGGIATATLAVGAFGVASVKSAAHTESLATSFQVLLGSVEAAQDRMKELSKFAVDTPFELPEVANASRVLETLTKGALSTGKGLTLVGDIASATQQPFDELAIWVGRLYDGLDSGRPVGKALMRLQELGVVSGRTRGQIEALQAQGKRGPQVWRVFTDAVAGFSGMMAEQGKTWSGLWSTMMDGLGVVTTAFGEPIMEFLKPGLQWAIDSLGVLEDGARQAGKSFVDALKMAGTIFRGIWLEPETAFKGYGYLLGSAFAYAGNILMNRLQVVRGVVASIFQIEYAQAFGLALEAGAARFGAVMTRAIYSSMLDLSAGIEYAWQNGLEFFDGGWRTVVANVGESLKGAFVSSVNALKAGLEAAFQGVKWVWDKILQGISKMPGLADETRKALAGGVGDIGGKFQRDAAPAERTPFKAQSFDEIRNKQFQRDTGILKGAYLAMEETAAKKWDEAGKALEKGLGDGSREFAEAANAASENVQDVFGSGELLSKANEAKNEVIAAGNKIGRAMDNAGTQASAAIRQATRGFVSRVAPSNAFQQREDDNIRRFGFKNRLEQRRSELELERQKRGFERGISGRTQFEKDQQGMDPKQRQEFNDAQREADFRNSFKKGGTGARSSVQGGDGLTDNEEWKRQFMPKNRQLPATPAPGEKPAEPAKPDQNVATIKDESIDKIVTKIGELLPK